jgi:hypothetical protein
MSRTGAGLDCRGLLVGCADLDITDLIERRAMPLFGPCRLIVERSLFLRIKRDSIPAAWHIDADGADTKPYDPCINVWAPVTSVGKDLPSLELIRRSHRAVRLEPELPPQVANRLPEWINEKFAPSLREIPPLQLGDAFFFDHYTMHRT